MPIARSPRRCGTLSTIRSPGPSADDGCRNRNLPSHSSRPCDRWASGRNRQAIVSDTSDDTDLDGLMERIRGVLARRRLGDGGGMPDAAPAAVSAPLLPPASFWSDQTVIDPTR